MSKSPPNILFLFTDQQRYDTIGALGNVLIRTPVLDRLCVEGTAFTRCYTPSPVCVPARAALASGLPPHVSGCCANGDGIDPGVASFMQRLCEGGYQTHGVGKMHFKPDGQRLWGFDQRDTTEGAGSDFRRFLDANGFDHVDEPHGVQSEMYYVPQVSQLPAHLHESAWVADRSIDFLNRRDRGRPFFLWSGFVKPHPPFEAPTPWNKLYRAAQMPRPFRPADGEDLWTFWNWAQNRYKYRDQGYDVMLMRTIKAMYYASISFLDAQVGRILHALGDEIDNTLIIFSSDHGEMLGDYGCVGKRCMLDAAARVPMLVRWPGGEAGGTRCDVPTSLLDVYPTLLTAAGVASPTVSDEGRDLHRLMNEPDDQRVVYSQVYRGGFGQFMATTRDRKYVYSEPDQRAWLFDLASDPHETHDLAHNALYADDLQRLRGALLDRHRGDDPSSVEGDAWRVYPRRSIPANPDAALIFMDPPGIEQRVRGLGEYAPDKPKTPTDSLKILFEEPGPDAGREG